MVNIIFTNPYYSASIAIFLSFTLAFAHTIEIYQSKLTFIILIFLVMAMLLNVYDDYGLIVLIVALIAVVSTLHQMKNRRQDVKSQRQENDE